MLNKTFHNTKTWPIIEANKIIKQTSNNDVIILETGYGPSNTPHIGTVMEVFRTYMIAKVLRQIQDKDVIILSIVDDMDGMRKIPPSMPNDFIKYLHYPLCNVPDPDDKYDSFATANIAKFQQFFQDLNLEYAQYIPTKDAPFTRENLINFNKNYNHAIIIIRSSDMYKSGSYNEILKTILHKHQDILDIMLPSFGSERKQTYSPFMPISPNTNKVLEVGVKKYLIQKNALLVEEDGKQYEISILNGECKLQWKIDFGMRHAFFGVDYEMAGKDIMEGTAPFSRQISKLLSNKVPMMMMYEMYLDKNGAKISKTKGNGIELIDFMKYISTDATKYFIYLSPMVAKRIDIQKLPAYMDDYIKHYNLYKENPENLENPLWYTNITPDMDPPNISAYTALNLVENLQVKDFNVLCKMIESRSKINNFDKIILRKMFDFYHDKYIQPEIEYFPSELVVYIYSLINSIDEIIVENNDNNEIQDEAIIKDKLQTALYSLGNLAVSEFNIESLKQWFLIFYQCLFGINRGPRLGSFFVLLGKESSIKLLLSRIKKEDLQD